MGDSMHACFHPAFKSKPFWWDAYEPAPGTIADIPKTSRVAIVGGGYAGLATALELSKQGIESVVLEAKELGFGASTRNAGFVGSYGNVGRRYSKGDSGSADELRQHGDAIESGNLVEHLIREEKIDCHWSQPGHLEVAWSRGHYAAMAAKVEHLNRCGDWGASLLPPEKLHEELTTDFYRGGMIIARSGLIHPALYYRGLLAACERRGVQVCSMAPVRSLTQAGGKWSIGTERGIVSAADVVIATNGYTGKLTPQFRRRLIPIRSYMIATEELPAGTVAQLIPKGRNVLDTRRDLTYCRPSPDGRRLLFGGRVRFTSSEPADAAPLLYRLMTQRFPQLDGCRITHAWNGNVAFTFDEASHMGRMDGLYYALGCNGAGIAMMTYLGTQTARKLADGAGPRCSFDGTDFPTMALYGGNPWFVPFVAQYFRVRDWLDRISDK